MPIRRFIKIISISLVFSIMVAAALISGLTAYGINQAKENIKYILLSNKGFHQYIQTVMHPAFFRGVASGEIAKDYYNPEILSSTFIVRTQHKLFNELRKSEGLPPVYYKLAAFNPRNPVNKADKVETELIKLFNNNRLLIESEEIVKIEGKKYIHYAIPFLENQQRCMRCHGDPDDAPPGVLVMYPGDGGFHEKVGDIRAIESIRMPIGNHLDSVYIVAGAISSGSFAFLMLAFLSAGLRQRVREKTAHLENEIITRKSAENNYREVVEGTKDLITKVDHDGKFTYVNHMGEQIFGLPMDELIGRSAFDFVHPEDRDETQRQFAQGLADKQKDIVFENRQVNQASGEVFIMFWTSHVNYDNQGKMTHATGIARDLSEHKELFQSYKLLFDEMQTGFAVHEIITDESGKPVDYRFISINPAYESLTGGRAGDMIGKTVLEVMPDTEQYWIDTFGLVALTGKSVVFDQYAAAIGKHFNVVAYRPKPGQFACLFSDVTQKRIAEDKLKVSEQSLRKAQEIGHVGSWHLDIEKNILLWSDEEYLIYGLSPQSFGATYEAFLETIHPDDMDMVKKTYSNAIDNNTPYECVHRIVRPGGEIRTVLQRSEDVVNEQGKTIHSMGVTLDITEQVEAQQKIATSLKEKEILLKEIHHRVKNNMAVISSLLSLQSTYIDEKKYLDMFRESQSRIKSMALIHEKLYLSDDFTHIDVQEYINSLAGNIRSSFLTGYKEIKFNIQVEKVEMDIDSLVPCGLMMNEIITNSFKHAFKEQDDPEITVVLKKIGDGNLSLTIRDNGIGFPEGYDMAKPTGLGHKLIKPLIKQIEGTMEVNTTDGVEFVFIFKEKIELSQDDN
jgi:PAS domain S-box-containing protein